MKETIKKYWFLPVFLVLLFAIVNIITQKKYSEKQERINENRLSYATEFMGKYFRSRMSESEIENKLKDFSMDVQKHSGCYGNFGYPEKVCAKGKTIITEIVVPETKGGGTVTAFIFVHRDLGFISQELMSAYPN